MARHGSQVAEVQEMQRVQEAEQLGLELQGFSLGAVEVESVISLDLALVNTIRRNRFLAAKAAL